MLWKIKEKAPEEFLLKFPEIHPVIANLLYQRKIIDHKKVEQFLCPDYYKDPYDPFLMLGMKKAIDRIIAAIFPPNRKADDKKEKIVIFGDYDADGVCASALLSQTLILLGADVSVYIPNREAEGYGMNAKAIEEFSRQNVNLVITVDCGISNKKEVDLAKKEGIDVIITDHHPIVQDVPDAFAVVDPKQKNDKYPFKFLAGVGVAYKLISALLKTLEMFSASLPLREGELEGVPPQEDKFSIPNKEEIKEKFQQFGGIDGYLKCMLDIVALGTVADVCPLIDENRTLVKYGLMILEKNWRLGIAELLKAAQIYDGKSELSLDTHSLGYQLGPRLNASGRIDHANTSYQLLITRSRLEAQELAKDIEAKNTKRQKLTKQIIDEIKKDENIAENNFIFASLPDCIAGIVGLIAGKITDEFGKPAFIISEKNELAKGSCR
ncbi:MAG: DHH family phosphoesterase, partial [bacterium]